MAASTDRDGRTALDRHLLLSGDRRRVRVTYAPVVNGERGAPIYAETSVWPATAEQVTRHIARLDALRPTDLVSLGEALAWVAMPGRIRERVLSEIAGAQATGARLRIRMLVEIADLQAWPWEFVALLELGPLAHLSLHPNCAIVRSNPTLAVSPTRQRERPLEFLVVYADPNHPSLDRLGADSQVEMIARALGRLPVNANLRLLLPRARTRDGDGAATREGLRQALRSGHVDVVHLLCHGVYDDRPKEGVVILEATGGDRYDAVGAREFASLFPDTDGPTLVLMDACESGSSGRGVGGRSVARALAERVGAVVGMQFLWPAAASEPFWNTFYSSLAVPKSLEDCLFAARRTLQRNSPEMGDWGCAVLYRTEGYTLRQATEKTSRSMLDEFDDSLDAVQELVGERFEHLMVPIRSLRDAMKHQVGGLADQYSVSALVEQNDPLYVWMAGADDSAPVITSPIWFTYLLVPPSELSWSKTLGNGPWGVKCLDANRAIIPDQVVVKPRVPLPSGIEWPAGWIRWEAWELTERINRPSRVRGMFRVLERERAKLVRKSMSRVSTKNVILNTLEMGDIEIQAGLYELALVRLRQIASCTSDATAFIARRLLAKIYAEMQRELTGARRMGDPEGLWSATLARHHGEAAVRALGLR